MADLNDRPEWSAGEYGFNGADIRNRKLMTHGGHHQPKFAVTPTLR